MFLNGNVQIVKHSCEFQIVLAHDKYFLLVYKDIDLEKP